MKATDAMNITLQEPIAAAVVATGIEDGHVPSAEAWAAVETLLERQLRNCGPVTDPGGLASRRGIFDNVLTLLERAAAHARRTLDPASARALGEFVNTQCLALRRARP